MSTPSVDWQDQAACRDVGPGLWLSGHPDDQDEAAAICQTCDVRTECLEWAMEQEAGIGPSGRGCVYGGLTPMQRAVLHAERVTRGQYERRKAGGVR